MQIGRPLLFVSVLASVWKAFHSVVNCLDIRLTLLLFDRHMFDVCRALDKIDKHSHSTVLIYLIHIYLKFEGPMVS